MLAFDIVNLLGLVIWVYGQVLELGDFSEPHTILIIRKTFFGGGVIILENLSI